MRLLIPTVCASLLSIASLACGPSAPPANTGGDGTGTTGGTTTTSSSGGGGGGGGGATTFADQVAQGQKLYADNCASCHGPSGEGKGGAPAVVGLKGGKALPLDAPAGSKMRKTQFKTVGDVLDFSQKAMPPGAGGSLKPEEYLAIMAFDLHANGIDLDKPLTASSAAATNIPR